MGTQIISNLSLEITEVNLSAFVYRLFHEDFSSFVFYHCYQFPNFLANKVYLRDVTEQLITLW